MDYETRSLATMLNRSDELELLALIEGELDAAAEAALRRRLVGDPQLLALLDKVRTDRAALRDRLLRRRDRRQRQAPVWPARSQ